MFDIPAQSADTALTEFARQADITLVFPFDTAKEELANPIKGQYTIELAIVKLLEGSGLYPATDDSGMLSVKSIVKDPPKYEVLSAPETESLNESEVGELIDQTERIAIVGTRAMARTSIKSSVPLDIISSRELKRQGSSDLLTSLTSLNPSFNVNEQPINDAATLVRPASLRGMASDHTLVLINGKRRHRSAVITFLGGGLSDGAQGVDISNISNAALKQVEVLRDGSAAQYGSDAIAGVINFVFDKQFEGVKLDAKVGEFYDGDGQIQDFKALIGFTLNESTYVNFSSEYKTQQATDRSVQIDLANELEKAGNEFINNPAQSWGIPKVKYDIKATGYLSSQLNSNAEFYMLTTLSQRELEGGFYFRNPHTRKGVFVNEQTSDALPRLLVADIDGINQGIECPEVFIGDSNVLDDINYQLIADSKTEIGKNCFAFNELFPGGFTPKFGGKLTDGAFYMGIKGEVQEWLFDLSLSSGVSEVSYHLSNSVNPSLGPDSPNSFSPGKAKQLERNVNLDFTKSFEMGSSQSLNFATGIELRRETFTQVAGDEASYAVGIYGFDPKTASSQGFGIGSNGFPGYQPQAAGKWSRSNVAGYIDVESALTPNLMAGAALRYEKFTDFGSTFDGKLTARYSFSPQFSVRTSLSTGFKAPTVGQSNVINVTTAFSVNGLEDQATLPPTNPIAIQLGASALQPEQSINKSLGIVSQINSRTYFTLDYFNIDLTDRISTTSAILLTEKDKSSLISQGVIDASSFSAAKYFTNDFDTSTKGIDLVLSFDAHIFNTNTQFLLAYNWTHTRVKRVTLYSRFLENGESIQESNLTEQRIRMLEDNLPAHRVNLTVTQDYGDASALLKFNYYSSFYEDHLDASSGLDIYSGDKLTVDFDLGYQINANMRVNIGANNLLNTVPDKNPYSGVAGARYPVTSPFGFNGGFYYLRGTYEF